MKSISYTLAFTFTSAVSFIYLFLSIGMVPYWNTLNGTELQTWWSGPFTNFSTLMVPIHLLSIVTIIFGFLKHRKGEKKQNILWTISLIGVLVCQVINFTLHGANFNPALQSGTLAAPEALAIFNDWDFYHTIRTISVCFGLTALIFIGLLKK